MRYQNRSWIFYWIKIQMRNAYIQFILEIHACTNPSHFNIVYSLCQTRYDAGWLRCIEISHSTRFNKKLHFFWSTGRLYCNNWNVVQEAIIIFLNYWKYMHAITPRLYFPNIVSTWSIRILRQHIYIYICWHNMATR